MKVSLLQENLNKAISGAFRAVSGRPQMPVLANVLLRAEKGQLLVVGTDLAMAIGLTAGGKVEKAGAITVAARDLAALIGNLNAGRVELSTEKNRLYVASGGTKAILPGIDAGEFPAIGAEGKKGVEIDKEEFNRGVLRAQFCVSGDDGRPVLTGIKVEGRKSQEGKGLKLTATDGYRLSVVEINKVKGELKKAVVIPGRILAETDRLAGGKKIEMAITPEGEARFDFENGWISGKTLAGDFPEVDKILPTDFAVEISVDRGELERAVKVAAIFARGSANIVKWEIIGRELKISANSPQIGENESIVEAAGKGSGVIAFNSRYLLDYLGSAAGIERVIFKMSEPLKPGMFNLDGENYIHVIMPVRVQK